METSFYIPLILACSLVFLCAWLEYFIIPRPRWKRPLSAWAVHISVCLFGYSLLLLVLLRPYCSFMGMLALMFTLVMINNTKYRSLHESLTAQDYEFITDIICHPRLFLPHFGVKKFLIATVCFLVAIVAFVLEPVEDKILVLDGQGGALLLLFLLACKCCLYVVKKPVSMTFEPLEDTRTLGLLASLWGGAKGLRAKPDVTMSPFAHMPKDVSTSCLPHLVAVQSESFFDPRPLYSGIKKEVLSCYDALWEDSIHCGALEVPAWGGNTVRTEFSFLTGLKQEDLGAHRFNPYEISARGYPIPSLLKYLKSMGYRTVCIHPFIGHFYKRDKVFSHWDVDEFLDIKAFAHAHHYGPFVTDIDLAKLIIKQVEQATQPTFVFAVTMENHGPLHLEKARNKDIRRYYTSPPPVDWEDMTAYLRHIKHADSMIGILEKGLQNLSLPASLCWYGDHVPIMPTVYASLPERVRNTSYVLWDNQVLRDKVENRIINHNKKLASSSLGQKWLEILGLI